MIRKTSNINVSGLNRYPSVFNNGNAADDDALAQMQELSGIFEADFIELCRKSKSTQFKIRKIPHPNPPLPMPLTPPFENAISIPAAPDTPNSEVPNFLKIGTKSKLNLITELNRSPTLKYTSSYKFTPTIEVESESDDEDEITKIQVRGWKISNKVMEALSFCITVCTTISNLVSVLNGNIRHLTVDQNPMIPENLLAYLISEDSCVKFLNVRSNQIGIVGAKSFAIALKSNRTLQSLSLWDNNIDKEGAEYLAELKALKMNQYLISLSLGRNQIGDEGTVAIAKALSRFPLVSDDQQTHKKILADLDRQRREQEEDPIFKKAKTRIVANHNRNSSAQTRKSEDNFFRNPTNQPPQSLAKELTVSAKENPKNAKNTKAAKALTTVINVKKDDAKAEKGKKKEVGNTIEKEKESDKKTNNNKKTTAVQQPKGMKKGKIEETREEAEESDSQQNTETISPVEPMYESNGQWFVLGNRTLNNLDISFNCVSEVGMKALSEAVLEQESSSEYTPENLLGILRISTQGNLLEKENPYLQQLLTLLNQRNPFEHNIISVTDGISKENPSK
ncbi:Leucine-rich repeat-containing protein 71 [Nowakowskiella sp. JEL0078]|nr:Leucine-rich repeat-containing protein 71 [Nowakowskiella sp. JEL0078]